MKFHHFWLVATRTLLLSQVLLKTDWINYYINLSIKFWHNQAKPSHVNQISPKFVPLDTIFEKKLSCFKNLLKTGNRTMQVSLEETYLLANLSESKTQMYMEKNDFPKIVNNPSWNRKPRTKCSNFRYVFEKLSMKRIVLGFQFHEPIFMILRTLFSSCRPTVKMYDFNTLT